MALTDANLVLENGQGFSLANTYVLRAEATAYHALRGNADWASADTETQVIALVQAADYINRRWLFVGQRLTATQALAWPRIDAFDLEGTDVTAEAGMVAGTSLTFDQIVAANDRLIRATGSWTDDGFSLGQRVRVSGSVSNNADLVITAITTAVLANDRLEFSGDVLVDEGPITTASVAALDPTIPQVVKMAQMEYALRALDGAELLPDPAVEDDSGGVVTLKREKVGTLEEETRFSDRITRQVLRAYPEADRVLLLSGLVRSAGVSVIRG